MDTLKASTLLGIRGSASRCSVTDPESPLVKSTSVFLLLMGLILETAGNHKRTCSI